MRGHTVVYKDFEKYIDINNSRNLAKYCNLYKEIIQYKKAHKLELEFKGTQLEVHNDLVAYLKNDFQINLMARTKIGKDIKIQNYAYKFVISE